jgi:type VI secretion system protein ImpE
VSTDAKALYNEGKLAAAIEAQLALVKDKPNDVDARALLADFMCFAGELERADKQYDLIGTQRQELSVSVALSRQLVRAATARREVFEKGRAPELLGEASPGIQAALRAMVALRAGDAAEAVAILAEAEAAHAPLRGQCNGEAFEGLRDGDDVTAGVLEVLSTTGKYFWVPFERIASMELHKPSRPRDLMWRPAHLEVREGPDGEVYIPAVYPTAPAANAPDGEFARLARATDWIGGKGAPTRGVGLRTLLVGEHGRTLHEIESLSVDAPAGGA